MNIQGIFFLLAFFVIVLLFRSKTNQITKIDSGIGKCRIEMKAARLSWRKMKIQ